MSKPVFKKCSTKAQQFCANMDKFSGDQYEGGRRIFVGQSINFTTGVVGARAWYQYGRKRNEFVVMFYCPWCGGTLGWNRRKS